MSHTRLVHRIQCVEAARSHVEVAELAGRIAAVDGVSITELLAEAERIAAACHQQGITSTEGMVQHVATELGIAVEELESDMMRYRELME